MSRIIIGVDGGENSADAIAFGGMLARSSGAAVTVAHAYPWAQLGFVGTHETNRLALEESEKMVRRVSEPLLDLPGLDTRSLSDPSAARALQELAEGLEAGLIVVGSIHTGQLGRAFLGSTAERLLHGSPCPVAVVPHGYRTVARNHPMVIACGWDGSPESEVALAAAEELAVQMPASLRVIRTLDMPVYYAFPPALSMGYPESMKCARTSAEQALDERMAHLSAGVEVAGELPRGPAARALIEASDTVDLMVLGSRGYGPLRSVLLGSVSSMVVREATCPVIVVPSGPERPVASVVAANPSVRGGTTGE